jgi:SNF2 family DNA or RNA helicase
VRRTPYPSGPPAFTHPYRKDTIKPNIATVDYFEQRQDMLLTRSNSPHLPRALKPDVRLKEHQLDGLAWLQHLFSYSPGECRGAVLADDMGLGKTLQILTLIAWAHEQDSNLPPALIVAPVTLLENWHEEARKFLRADALLISEVYGDTLAKLRVPKEDIDEQLRHEGLVRFLRPGWVGQAKIVFTTYETLRDLEFSFAAEKWSILVCDEAQKVKNPNALVTRAAKKQNARFRVACTGTPVENSLADLWCLFDFVQPGLLGALNEFGQLYRRPIEAKTDDEKRRIEELRDLIKPQILRRLKVDVAKDLPKKLEVDNCKSLQLTTAQRALYSQAVGQFGRRSEPGAVTTFKNALGLLHYLRLICTDPKPHGLSGFCVEPLEAYRTRTPKLDWLLRLLKDIRSRNEKALLFCEFKDIQRLLRHYIEEELKYVPDIINGDTATSSKSDQSRQKRIRAFQQSPGFGVIILSPLAVGFGVNIQAANHVIHYTRTWNPAKEDQATDRAYRIGQEKDVYVYCPVVAAADFKTFDVKLDELLRHKRALASDMLNGSGDLGANEFDLGEVAPPGTPGLQPRLLTFDDVLRMHSRQFEAYIAALWSRQGYPKVTLTPTTGDGGVDVVALHGKDSQLIQCKTSQSAGRELGWEAIKDVVTGEAAYRVRYGDVQFLKVCVTTQSFNSGARKQALLNQVRLIDQAALEALHRKYPITLEDVERVLYAG